MIANVWFEPARAGGTCQPRSNSMASQQSLGTEEPSWNCGETRIARGGWPYTRREFMNHYGGAWKDRWQEAPRAPAGGAPQPAAAAVPGRSCTPAQLFPPAPEGPARLRPWPIAGTPQPGAAAGPSVPGTLGQQPPQAQAAPTNAGAPPPGPSVPGTLGHQPPQAQAAPTNAGAPQPDTVFAGAEHW